MASKGNGGEKGQAEAVQRVILCSDAPKNKGWKNSKPMAFAENLELCTPPLQLQVDGPSEKKIREVSQLLLNC